MTDSSGGSTGEDQHPTPLGEGQMMPLLVSSPSPGWVLSPPTASHDPLSWTLHSSPLHSPLQLHHTVADDGNLLEYDVEQMISASLLFQSSPQALSPQSWSPMLVDGLWSFDDLQVSPTEMDPGAVEANHAAAEVLTVQRARCAGSDTSCLLKERLTQALRYFKESTDQHGLVQVWAPVKHGDRYVLTTSGQPFVLDHQSIGLLQFRAVSMMYMFSVDGDNYRGLGLPGRVYWQKAPEWTPNVQYYSSVEYPQLNHAISFNVHGVVALPVFDPSVQSCVCVIEVVMTSKKINYAVEVDKICKALEAVSLKSTEILDHSPWQICNDVFQICNEGRQTALVDILELLAILCEELKLPLAQTWFPLDQESQCDTKRCISTSDGAFHVVDPGMWGFRDACVEHHLQEGQGVPGKSFYSRRPCFSKDVRLFSKLEYPIVHYARMFGLAGSVALCVQSFYTRNDDYILEFFLPPDCGDNDDQKALLQSILTLVTQGFRSLRVVGDADLSKIYSRSLLHTDENEKPKNTFGQSEGFHCSSPWINTHDGLGVQKLNRKKKGVAVKQDSRNMCSVRLTEFEASKEPQEPSCSQPLQIREFVENPNDPSSINNDSGVDGDLIELNNKDVEVEPGDVSTKRRKLNVSPKRRKLKSKAWLHFTMVEDSGFLNAKCKHCGKLYKADSKIDGTSRLLRHLKVCKPLVLANQEAIGTHNRGKHLVLSECREIVHDKVLNKVIVLDSQFSEDTVCTISRIEEQLFDKINSAPEEEILVQIDNVALQKNVMKSLADPKLEDGPQKYLQDDIIDACIHILKYKNKDDMRAHGRVFIETTVVCQLLHKAACSIYPIRGQEIKDHKKYGTEYLRHDMIFLPINQNRSHWYLAVINTKKQEIHVLDSLGIQLQEREELKYTLKQIEQCLELASIEFQSSSWPDYKVASWKVTQVEEIPKQTDMSSCGLFMIKYLEHWTGEKLNEQFTQADIDHFRLKLASELMSSPLNKAGK